ncbi:MAG: hypothetical protein AMXMBFR20_20140 [Planctomycetia bacterium]
MTGLGDLPGGSFDSRAYAVSADGNAIVGRSNSANGVEAFFWSGATGMIGLGDLPGLGTSSQASAVSGDGSLVVGFATPDSRAAAFIWDSVRGMRELQTVLSIDFGLDLAGWQLISATGISSDGTVITGAGINPGGQTEAWIAVIPEPVSIAPFLIVFAILRPRNRIA